MKSNVSVYTDATRTKVLLEGDPEARYLLIGAGTEVQESDLEAFAPGMGLARKADTLVHAQQQQAAAAPAPVAAAPAVEEKMTEKAAVEDKAQDGPAQHTSRKNADRD